MYYNIITIDHNDERATFTHRLMTLRDEWVDIEKACKEAAEEYVKTPEGFTVYAETNREHFDWEDFFVNVPNKICAKHGFVIIDEIGNDFPVDISEQLIDRNGPVFHIQIEWETPENEEGPLPTEMDVPFEDLLRGEDEQLRDLTIGEYKVRTWDYVSSLCKTTPKTIIFS